MSSDTALNSYDLVRDRDSYELVREAMTYYPDSFAGSGAERVDTGPHVDFQEFFRRHGRRQRAAIWTIDSEAESLTMTTPLAISQYRDGDYYFAENETLAVCGVGRSPDEASANLSRHVLHFVEYYRSLDESRLTGEALRLKTVYSDLFCEE